MIELLELIRKIEVLFLPLLFPKKWQNPPPSYRLIVPLLKRLTGYEKRYPWVSPLLYSIQENLYPEYHKDALVTQISKERMRSVRFILAVVGVILLLALTKKAELFSPWIKGGLLFGSCVLFINGAMHLSISALWATWGFLFPVLLYLGIGTSPWALAFLSLWGLLWHVHAIREKNAWHWIDGLCTFPTLFFWVGNVGKILHSWPLWQSGLLFVFLWSSVWIVLVRMGHSPRVSRACQLFWPASLTVVTLIILVKPGVLGFARWGLWFFATLGLSFGISRWIPRISSWSFLFHWKTITSVFMVYGIILFILGTPLKLKDAIDTGLFHLVDSLELLWWVVGAGIITSLRGMTIIFLKWGQAFLHSWLLPLALWFLPILGYYLGWFSPIIGEIGKLSIMALWAFFAMGATLLAWRRKEVFIREWIFWGCFASFLFHQYVTSAQSTVDIYLSKTPLSTIGFITLAIWLLWFNYYAVGKYLTGFHGEKGGTGGVAFLGALLWLLVALLWLNYVDQQFLIRGRITFALLRGFIVMGVPFIIYHIILCRYFKMELAQNLPWGFILLTGIGLVQILQGFEHSVVAWIEQISLSDLQKKLHHDLLRGIPIDQLAPPWVTQFYWTILWRTARWLFSMMTLTGLLRHRGRVDWPPSVLFSTVCFTSLAVWTAEDTWFFWPSMPLEWAVILRPWVQTTLIYDIRSLTLCALYILAGLVWGWIVHRIFYSRTVPT